MAHILFLTPQLPYPPHQGTALRNFGLVRGVAQAGHDVTLLSFWESHQPPAGTTPLADLCRQVITVPAPLSRSRLMRALELGLTSEADMARRLRSPAFEKALQDLLAYRPFDAVHIEGIEMARCLPVIREVQPRTALIYDAHNAEFDLQRRVYEVARSDPRRWLGAAYSFVQWQRLMEFERKTCRSVRHVLAVSQADAEALRALAGVPVTVIPNGVDVDAYLQPPDEPVDLDPLAMVFTGKMDFRPNVDAVLWFSDEVLPRIHQEAPEAHFYVVGQKPHARLEPLRGMPGITLTGWVPEVKPYLHAATLYVTPLRMGSGTRFKVLQAMASGVPIVSTSLGAEGVGVTAGQDILIGDNAADFAHAAITLLHDAGRRAALAEAARDLVSRWYDWPVILPPLFALYDDLKKVPA